MSKNLLNEAIADAKAVKETAYANAKLALQEALAPHIQSMISATLAEELDEEVATDSVNEDNTEYGTDDMMKVKDITEKAESDEEKTKDEAYKGDDDKKKEEAVKADDEDHKKNEAKAEDKDDMDESDDMSDLDLEAIIRELEEELASSDIGQGDNKEPSSVSSAADTDDPGKNDLIKSETSHGDDMEKSDGSRMIDLEELIHALREIDSDDEDEMHNEEYSDDEDKKKMETLQNDLDEAYEVITFLKNQLNEINLLNAKLLYSTKLFKKFELSESQKAKVIENLDRTKNVREAKLIYTTLAETFNTNKSKKSSLKESFASDAIPSTKPSSKTTDIISGGDEVANRFKILAGLKK